LVGIAAYYLFAYGYYGGGRVAALSFFYKVSSGELSPLITVWFLVRVVVRKRGITLI
jgi:hypothetical protein